jgi:hypothetical protein
MIAKILEGSRSMFGHHKLYHEGATASGVIIRLQAEHEHHEVSHYDLLIDVEFDDGTHGHFKERVKPADVGHCREGDVLPVRYDLRDYSKAVIDIPALATSKYLPKENRGYQPQQPGGGPAGTDAGIAGLSALLGGGSMADIIREARSDPQGLRDRLIQQAQAAGAQVFVSQSGGMTPVAQPGMTAEPTMESNPEFQARPQFEQEQFEQEQFEQTQFQQAQFQQAQFQAPVQPQAPVQFQMPSQPHKQPEPGDFDPNEEF